MGRSILLRHLRRSALQSTLPHAFCYLFQRRNISMLFKNLASKGLIVAVATATLAGCYTMDPYSNERKVSKTTKGAGIGALAGAVAGMITGDDSRERRKR